VTDRIVQIRASSFSSLIDCPSRWEGIHLLGMRGKRTGPLQLGTAIHASTAVFDQGRLDNSGITVDEAAAALVDALHHPGEDVDWGDITVKKAEQIGLGLHTRYCTDFSPKWEFKEVEMTIPPIDVDVGDLTIRLTGTMDRSRVVQGGVGAGIVDMKSGKTAVEAKTGKAKTKGHGVQIGVYELLYERATNDRITLPAEIIGLQTNSKLRIGVGEIANAREQLVGTTEQPGALDAAALYLKSGIFPGNPR
jgi:hypothetical protein